MSKKKKKKNYKKSSKNKNLKHNNIKGKNINTNNKNTKKKIVKNIKNNIIKNTDDKINKILDNNIENKIKDTTNNIIHNIKNEKTINNIIIENNIDDNEPFFEETTLKKLKTHNVKHIFIILITIILLLILPMIFFINKNISISLIGNESKTIEVFNEYNDPGYNATLFNTNINNLIKTKSNLNTKKLGTYTITYQVSLLNTHKVTRKITVVDTTKPTIKLNGKETITMYVDDDYKEEGILVEDNYDKDLSSNIIINSNLDTNTVGTYTITYTVKDSSNNENTISRTIKVKNKPAYIKTCNSSNPINKYICENNYNISVGYYNLTNNNTYYYNKHTTYYGASLIKILDALYVYDNNLINDNLKTHVKKIITVSDNPSHEYLVFNIGINNLKKYAKSLGVSLTISNNDIYGFTNVSDQIAYMKKLYSITKDGQNDELKSFFLNTRKNALLFDNSPLIMHKYGHWESIYHNSGIVLDEHPYIVTILTTEGYKDYNKIISTISKLIYDYHKQQEY